MTPQTFTFPMQRARSLRWVIARALILMCAGGMRLSMKLLAREHPTRVFIEGRLAESIPAVERTLCRGRLCSYLGEVAVGLASWLVAWSVVDGLLDLMVGPVSLLSLLP